jgi:phytoene desaturase (3,4-didehydrolycopene-forming)
VSLISKNEPVHELYTDDSSVLVVFEEMFEDLDEKISNWYTLKKCFPNYLVHYHDGETVTLSTDMAQMKLEVEKWEGKDGWARFLDFMNEVSRFAASIVLKY